MIKNERVILLCLAFFLPLGTRIILKSWGGSFNEWNSAFFYLTDIFVLVILALWAIRVRGKILKLDATNLVVLGFLAWTFVSIFVAQNQGIAFYRWIKLFEGALLFFYLKDNFFKIFSKETYKFFLWALVAGGVIQTIVAAIQFFSQKAIGLARLGESPIAVSALGVAKISAGGVTMIRAYGLLPHPNILAGFLLLSIGACLAVYFLETKKFFLKDTVMFIVLSVLVLGVFLTFSRSIIVALLLLLIGLGVFLKKKNLNVQWRDYRIIFFGGAIFITFGLIFLPELAGRFTDLNNSGGLDLRMTYNGLAGQLIKAHPLLGVGAGNFVWQIKDLVRFPWQAQPVHNIFFIIGAEGGAVAVLLFVALLGLIFIRAGKYLMSIKNSIEKKSEFILLLNFILVIIFLIVISFWDHYLWTIWQGQLMLWLCLGILAVKAESARSSLLRPSINSGLRAGKMFTSNNACPSKLRC